MVYLFYNNCVEMVFQFVALKKLPTLYFSYYRYYNLGKSIQRSYTIFSFERKLVLLIHYRFFCLEIALSKNDKIVFL